MSGTKATIAAFYKFIELGSKEDLELLRAEIKNKMTRARILGTVILASEGINSTICGTLEAVNEFVTWLSSQVRADIRPKFSSANGSPFRKVDVKIKPEIVTLKRDVDLSLGNGTHVSPSEWNGLISDPEVLVLDTRNDYEFKTGTFDRALNPGTEKFSELPDYIEKNLESAMHKKVAMFCTGGIRCEKFAPYMRSLGFETVFQLDGGILKYLEEVPAEEQLWRGECYVFDTRVSVDATLRPAGGPDLSQDQ